MSRVSEQSGSPDNIELKIVEEELPSISDITAEIETLTKFVEEPKPKEVTPEKIVEEKELKIEIVEKSPEKEVDTEIQIVQRTETDTKRPEPVVELEDKRVNATDEAKIDSLRIVESDKYEIRYLPLKDDSPKARRLSKDSIRAEFVRSTSKDSDLSQEVPYNGERRKSVKEIIESINRSQGLLMATNYTPMHGKYEYGEFSDRPELPKRSRNERAVDVDGLEVELRSSDRRSYYDNVPEMLENLERQSATFERCTPGRSSLKKSPSYEWNPVPKPRRSHNFSSPESKE